MQIQERRRRVERVGVGVGRRLVQRAWRLETRTRWERMSALV